MSKRVLVITSCGKAKHDEPKPAWQLYKSRRIKAVYNRRSGCDMAIISAKYGLVGSDSIIEPYEAVMTTERAKELVSQVAERIEAYDYIVFFKGGAQTEYNDCMREACQKAGKTLVSLGYGMMGDINELPKVIGLVEQGRLERISEVKSARVDWF